jgi:hypothetical protein
MAYYSSTEKSSISNPPIQLIRGVGGALNTSANYVGGSGLWLYSSSNSATELSSGTNSGQFFTDAVALGMKTGDVMMVVASTASSTIGFAIGSMYVTTAYAYMSTGSQTNSTAGA